MSTEFEVPEPDEAASMPPLEPPATGDVPVAWFEPLHVKLVVGSGRWLRSKAVVG